jgi:peptide deformylase
VHCLDHNGEAKVIRASGWYARILQHEIDHLNGAIYIDRMCPRTFMSVENYKQYWKNQRIEVIKMRLEDNQR